MSRIFAECQRCGGSGSIETSRSEDARFSYQDQCPECASWGVVPISEPSEEMVERFRSGIVFYLSRRDIREGLTAALFSSDAGERMET